MLLQKYGGHLSEKENSLEHASQKLGAFKNPGATCLKKNCLEHATQKLGAFKYPGATFLEKTSLSTPIRGWGLPKIWRPFF